MIYYLLFKGDKETVTIQDRNRLGEVTYKKNFQPNVGYKILRNLIKTESDELKNVRIFDHTGKRYSIQEFLDKISKYNIGNIPK